MANQYVFPNLIHIIYDTHTYIYIYIYIYIVIFIIILVEFSFHPMDASRNLDEVFTYNHIWL